MKIKILAKPNSKTDSIEKIEDEFYIVRVNKPPVNNLANQAIIKIIANHFKVRLNDVEIESGHHSKVKIVSVME